jgi:hypothetical protein
VLGVKTTSKEEFSPDISAAKPFVTSKDSLTQLLDISGYNAGAKQRYCHGFDFSTPSSIVERVLGQTRLCCTATL